MRILDLGCGSNKRKGAIGADLTRGSAADVITNLDQVYYPFKDSAFDLIVLTHVIEHIWDISKAIEEIWRIARPGASVEGAIPHFPSAGSYADPTRRHHWSLRTFHFLAALPQRHPAGMRRPLGLPYRSGDVGHRPEVGRKFVVADLRLTLNPLFRKLGIERAVNPYPELYEAFFTIHAPGPGRSVPIAGGQTGTGFQADR